VRTTDAEHMMASNLFLLSLPAVLGGLSATVSSSDLASGPAFGNLKATWDADLTMAGSKAKLSLLYDLKAKKDFIKEAKLAGALKGVGYTLSHAIGKGVTGLTLSTKQKGHTLKAVGDSSDKLTQVSAKGSASVGGYAIDYEPVYSLKKKSTKLTLSAALGGGVSATGVVTATNAGAFSSGCDFSYDASLGEGRELSASVDPAAKSGEIEVTDTATEPGATWVAQMSLAMGEKPGLTLRRSVKF